MPFKTQFINFEKSYINFEGLSPLWSEDIQFDEALTLQMMLFQMQYERKETLLATKPEEYVGVLVNTLMVAYKARNYEVIGRMLSEFEPCLSLPFPRHELAEAIYAMYRAVYDFHNEHHIKHLLSLETFLHTHENTLRLDAKFNIRFVLAQSYSKLHLFTQAKEKYFTMLDDDGKSYIYEERQTLFRLHYLIAFYEELMAGQSADYAFFQTSVNSFYERLRKDKEYFALELAFIKFFKRIHATLLKKEHRVYLENLQADLYTLFASEHPFFRHIKYDYDFQSWIDTKLKNP